MTEIYDGRARAAQLLSELRARVARREKPPRIVSFYVNDDPGSRLYAHKKAQAAAAVGIEFVGVELSFGQSLGAAMALIQERVASEPEAGIMIQKPTQRCFADFWATRGLPVPLTFGEWWHALVALVPPERDVDGLSPLTQQRLDRGELVAFLPATVQAVVTSVEQFRLADKKILLIGRSDLLGRPLAGYWRGQGLDVELIGRRELAEKLARSARLCDYDLIVTATGQPELLTGVMIREGVILVDVGEPQPDVQRSSVVGKAAFLTPVPGGIGPLTIASLLGNVVRLSELDGEFELVAAGGGEG